MQANESCYQMVYAEHMICLCSCITQVVIIPVRQIANYQVNNRQTASAEENKKHT